MSGDKKLIIGWLKEDFQGGDSIEIRLDENGELISDDLEFCCDLKELKEFLEL